MNSQFSTGFVIALVIGIAAGAFWPKYGPGLTNTALDRDQDIQEVSLARGNGQQGGCGGSCEDSHRGSVGQCAGNNKSGRGQGGRGCSGDCEESQHKPTAKGPGRGMGRGQGGHGCSGDCEESQHKLTAKGPGRGMGRGQSGHGCSGDCEESDHKLAAQGPGRGMGRRGRATLVSKVSKGRRQRHAGNAQLAKTETCQESDGHCHAKAGCSDKPEGADCEKTLTTNRPSCNASDEDHGTCASKSEAQSSEKEQRGRDRDSEHSLGQHRGPGSGLGLGLGPGWRWNLEQAAAADTDDDIQAEADD